MLHHLIWKGVIPQTKHPLNKLSSVRTVAAASSDGSDLAQHAVARGVDGWHA
jgi:hypothetical protein